MSDSLKLPRNPFPAGTESEWRSRVDAVLKGADFTKKLVGRTHDGLAIQPLYQRQANAAQVTGATSGKPWRVMARVDHPDADEAARLAREDLEGGADALTLVFPGARSANGFGIPCETVADLDAALAGVQIELIKLRLDPAPAGRVHALSLAALVEKRKLAPGQMDIDFGMDPIASLTSIGQVPWDWANMAQRLGETVSTLIARGFKGPFLTIDLRRYHEAGASEGQELAAGLAQAVLYLRALEANGVALTNSARALSFIVPVDADQFMGIAKLRALRKLWARIESASGLSPQPLTIHAETSWRMMTKRDPHVNILRATVATFAAGIGGADSVTVLPFTSTLGLPDAAARRLARNTSIVLQEESSLWRVADPAAGAGGYEALTEELCAKAWTLFQDIEREGGLVQSLVAGKPQARIAETAKARAKAVATRKEAITGTSEFANLTEVSPEVLDVKPSGSRIPKARAKTRFGMGTAETIAVLLAGASRADAAPVMVGRLDATPLPSHRVAEPFEALRDRADVLLEQTGQRPGVTLVTIGPVSDHAARLAFTRNAFETGGFAVSVLPSSGTIVPPSPASGRRKKEGVSSLLPLAGEGGAHAPDEGKPRLFCLVGSDAAYETDAAEVATALKPHSSALWLAGRPGELEAVLVKAGVTRFVFAGCDMVECLAEAFSVLEKR